MNTNCDFVERYREDGYVVVEGLLDPDEDLQPVVDEYGALLDQLADQWVAEGTISTYDSTSSVVDRLLRVMSESGGTCFQPLDISLPLDAEIENDTPMHQGSAVFELLRNEKILDAVEALIGGEIYSNPVQHTRVKPPETRIPDKNRQHTLISQTFWHQDLAVIDEEADHSDIVNVWIPVTEATLANGCMVVVPRSHLGGLVFHCKTPTWNGIPEAEVGDERVPLPMKPGDALFLNKLMKHSSLPNRSDGIRWSFDVRYNPVGQPTGRPWFPGFIARSRANRASELRSSEVWAESWREARRSLATVARPKYNRWSPDDPRCA